MLGAPRLDRSQRTPLYQQLRRILRRDLDAGVYLPGDRLPSENMLARTHGVSRHLVRQALLGLVAEGRVVARQGDGYYVNAQRIQRELPVLASFTGQLRRLGLASRITVLRQELVDPSPLEGGPAVLVERVVHVGDEPVALLADWFDPRLAGVLLRADLSECSLYEFVEQAAGLRAVRAPTLLRVDFADEREATLLGVAEGAPLIHLKIDHFTEDDVRFSRSSAAYRSDRFEFTLEKLEPRRTGPGGQDVDRP